MDYTAYFVCFLYPCIVQVPIEHFQESRIRSRYFEDSIFLLSFRVFLYMLGLSYRAVETFLLVFGRKGSKSSVERDVAQAGQKARALHTQAPAMRVRILGVDGIGAKMAGQNAGLLFYVDIERQQLLCVEPVKETDTQRIRRHVRRMWKANLLLQHIERTWSRVSRDPCDANNNTTERGIGLTYKIRSKTMRGFKNWDKELAHPYLAQFK